MNFYVIAETSCRTYTAVLSVSTKSKTISQFHEDWKLCSEKVCLNDFESNPINTCEEQYRLMKLKGWTITELSLEEPVMLP